MKFLLILTLIAALGGAASMANDQDSPSFSATADHKDRHAVQWIIGLETLPEDPEAFTADLAKFANLPLTFVRTGSNNILIVRIGAGGDPGRMSQLSTHPQVRYAEPDRIVTLSPPKPDARQQNE